MACQYMFAADPKLQQQVQTLEKQLAQAQAQLAEAKSASKEKDAKMCARLLTRVPLTVRC